MVDRLVAIVATMWVMGISFVATGSPWRRPLTTVLDASHEDLQHDNGERTIV